ncbi:hypothetical protein [Vulcanisaeta distributa]|uniref:Queuine/other tRNA-ribosyltransferase n=1 Tax=Vulcanisaeta distributa (strain DSM 14429 / JCM 11212 / NBRC 100878 / IC-017) TaxID=572478 RepID=E1QSS9_VULDI|nr:hypothetical protein [Vulcanisaeta distributa]ADN49596.1 hypothetical protein Vdis_0183 [Vulcanisaeta distributa DSM 14429]
MRRLKFILPDWDDIVDSGYDFISEKPSEGFKRDKYVNGARLWELVGNVIDGVLVSISVITKTKLNGIRSAGGVRGFMRLPSSMQVIGDCGAWQYRYMDVPPYTISEVLQYYEALGVDYGVTLDHIPLFGDSQRRIEITINNAIKMLEAWRGGNYGFRLMASVQGLTIDDYVNNLERLYKVGYRHFAIGGLARRDTKFIDELVTRIREVVSKLGDVEKVHFLGITRLSVIPKLRKLSNYVGEVSFDSSTVLRIAWTRELGNYLTTDGKAYTAIRIVERDDELMRKLRLYDEGRITYDEVMSALRSYVARIGHTHYLPYYAALLRDMPWKKCDCGVCRSIGIDVVIFRGNNRNRRRGFHNVYVFSKLLNRDELITKFTIPKLEVSTNGEGATALSSDLAVKLRGARRVLIITNCTSSKTVNINEVQKALMKHSLRMPSFDIELEDRYREVLRGFIKPAGEMYGGSFRAIKNLADELRRLGKVVDLYIISARYGLIREDYPIIPYEASLKGRDKEWIRNWSRRMGVEDKLMRVVGNGYDLVIVALPREYAHAIEGVLNRLVHEENAVLILPKSAVGKVNGVRAAIIIAGSLSARLRKIRELREIVESLAKSTLDQWLV